jgi:integrase
LSAIKESKKMHRHQEGYIWRKGRSWYGRWYRSEIDSATGQVVRRQHCEKLTDLCDRYRSKSDVRPLLEDKLRSENDGRTVPQSTLSVVEYAEKYFIPHIEHELKPSTINGYKGLWRMYLAPRLRNTTLRDFRCVDATNLLSAIHNSHHLGRKSLRHCKGLLSSIFTFAKRQGALDGLNPVQDAGIPRAAASSNPTYAATPEEVLAMVNTLTDVARTAVALMYFCGLRPGEARAARWEDYNGKTLQIRASMWRTQLTEPKTTESAASVPVANVLATILNESRRDSGHILARPSGNPADLHNLARRVVAPALRKAGIPWHGWYALRRGIATLATSVESPLAAKGLLRHSNLATTQAHYIKDIPSETARAMEKIDALCNNARAEAERRH